MSEAAIGAKVHYCGHEGWFIADIFKIGDVNVVKAGSMATPVTPQNLVRKHMDEVTHHLSDFPKAGCWCPERGMFIVPENQVTELNKKKNAKRAI